MATMNILSRTISPSPRLLPSNSHQPLQSLSFLSPPTTSSFTIHSFLSLKHTTNFATIAKLKPRSLSIVSAIKKLSESDSVPFSPENDVSLTSDSGVYAVYDSNGELQFIGLSKNVAASVDTHRKKVPELCSSIKVPNLWIVEEFYLKFVWLIWKSHLLYFHAIIAEICALIFVERTNSRKSG